MIRSEPDYDLFRHAWSWSTAEDLDPVCVFRSLGCFFWVGLCWVQMFKLLIIPNQLLNNHKSIVHLQSPRCTDHGGCADQFDGLGACVNLAAPLQISELFNRFVFVYVLVLVFVSCAYIHVSVCLSVPRCLCQSCSSSSDQWTLYMRSWCGCFREWKRAMWYQDRRHLPNPFLIFRFDLSTTSMKGLCGNAGCCHCLRVIGNAIGGPKNPSDKEPSAKKPTAKRPKRKKEQRPKSKKRKTKKQKRKKPKLKKPKTLKPKGKKSISGWPKPSSRTGKVNTEKKTKLWTLWKGQTTRTIFLRKT